jgi:mycofactocin precursor
MPDITADLGEAATAAERHDKPEVAELPAAPELEAAPERGEQLIEAELLVEDVSIDGMCGVY